MTESRLNEKRTCAEPMFKQVAYGASDNQAFVACNEPLDVPFLIVKICATCGRKEGEGHGDADCGGIPGSYSEVNSNGRIERVENRRNVVYAETKIQGPCCKNGHVFQSL